MTVTLARKIADLLGKDYQVIPSSYDDGPPPRIRILITRRGWLGTMKKREIGYIDEDEVFSNDKELLNLLEAKIPYIRTKLTI